MEEVPTKLTLRSRKMSKKNKFITLDKFQAQREELRKSQEAEKKKKRLSIITGVEFSSVTKIGLDCSSSSGVQIKTAPDFIEQVVPNPTMINILLGSIGQEKWNWLQPYVMEQLEKTSPEYLCLENISKSLEIVGIDRIYNPYLLLQYNLRMLEYGGRSYEKKICFHGTYKQNVRGICSTNFDWRLNGSAVGCRFGKGVSFTPFSNYAMKYGDQTDQVRVMFAVEVLTGGSCLGDANTNFPPAGKDTTDNGKGSVFVKYDDNTFCPLYLIHYSIKENVNNDSTIDFNGI